MKNYCYNCMEELPEGGGICPHCQSEAVQQRVVYRLAPGTILANKYLVGNCLGEGGFGITYIGRDLMLDIKVAIKEYYPNGYVNRNNTVNQEVNASTESQQTVFQKGKENFLEEARKVAKFLGEPGIVGIREYFEENGTAYIIMEYLDGINLASYIKKNGRFDARQIFKLMLPVTYSLKRVHEAGLIHRDISPDNIMYMRNGSLKLMDFGSARYFTNEQREMSVILKQGYAPEEQYRKNGKQGPWTDVYGLCATIYRCITGNIPEDALDRLRCDELVPPSEMGIMIEPAFENILIHGLEVFKENRCQNMDELSQLIELALENPHKAAIDTAHLNTRKKPAATQDEERTTLAEGVYDNYVPAPAPVDRPAYDVSQQAASRPVFTPQQQAAPVAETPRYAAPVNNAPYEKKEAPAPSYPVTQKPVAFQPSQKSNASYTAPTPAPVQPKKKKTGLIIGLIVGGVAVLALVITLIIVFSSPKDNTGGTSSSGIVSSNTQSDSIDGTWKLIEMRQGTTDMTSVLDGYTVTMTVSGTEATLDYVGQTQEWTVNQSAKTISIDGTPVSYKVSGNKLTLQDSSGKMVFEKLY